MSSTGILPVSSMGVSPMSVRFPYFTAETAVLPMAKMAMLLTAETAVLRDRILARG